MLETVAIVLIAWWLLGFVSGTMGNFTHVPLIVAVVLFLVRFISGGSSETTS